MAVFSNLKRHFVEVALRTIHPLLESFTETKICLYKHKTKHDRLSLHYSTSNIIDHRSHAQRALSPFRNKKSPSKQRISDHHGDLYPRRVVRLLHKTLALGALIIIPQIKIQIALPGYLTGPGRTGRSLLAWCDRFRSFSHLSSFQYPSYPADH